MPKPDVKATKTMIRTVAAAGTAVPAAMGVLLAAARQSSMPKPGARATRMMTPVVAATQVTAVETATPRAAVHLNSMPKLGVRATRTINS